MECIICYDEYKIEDEVVFNCKHKLCVFCYEKLLNSTIVLRCPLCRTIIENNNIVRRQKRCNPLLLHIIDFIINIIIFFITLFY